MTNARYLRFTISPQCGHSAGNEAHGVTSFIRSDYVDDKQNPANHVDRHEERKEVHERNIPATSLNPILYFSISS